MKNVRSFILGFLCAILIIALAAGVVAATFKDISIDIPELRLNGKINLNSPNVKVDGKTIVFQGGSYQLANGCNAPSGLIYVDSTGGRTTYLPIRKVSEAIGVSIDWDSSNNAVLITGGGSSTQPSEKTESSQSKSNSTSTYDLTTVQGLTDYINQEFGTMSTPLGDYTAKVSITENTSSVFPQDYEVRTECYFPWYDLKYSIKYTDEQKADAISKLRSYQENVYNIVSQYLPGKKLMGGYYLGYYEYPSLKVGYESTKVFYWRNFTDGITVSYSDSYITYFHWYNAFDDYVFD